MYYNILGPPIPDEAEENSQGFNRLPQSSPCSGSGESEELGDQLATQETGSSGDEEAVDEEEKLDPKIKKGLEKIRKLDRILADKTKVLGSSYSHTTSVYYFALKTG